MNRYELYISAEIPVDEFRRFRKSLPFFRSWLIASQETTDLPHSLSLYERKALKEQRDGSMTERQHVRALTLWLATDPYSVGDWGHDFALYFDGRRKPSVPTWLAPPENEYDPESDLYCPECGDFTEDGRWCRSCIEAEEDYDDEDGYHYYDDE